MPEIDINDLNWSVIRGRDAGVAAVAFRELAEEINGFIRAVRSKQAAGTGSQWSSIESFSHRIQPEAAKLISETFLDPMIVKWFVQQESHIPDPQNYLTYLQNNADRLMLLQARVSPSASVVFEAEAERMDKSLPKPINDSGAVTFPPSQPKSVFISHSAQDAQLAGQVVDLLRSALNLRADSVRCTSVDGYRLPAGADSDEQLRDEALHSIVFIGILSPLSMASAYVLFELGARWGAKKPIVPLLAPGMGPQALRGPLVGLNALSCDSAAQLHQLVADVSRALDAVPEGAAVYQRHVDAIIYSAHATPTVDTTTAPSVSAKSDAVSQASSPASEMSQASRDGEYSDAEEVITRHCEREWPDDYNMRAYCMKQQRQAVAKLKAGAPDDIPIPVFLQIRAKCAREWPDDYNMRLYSEQQQHNAYRQLQKSGR